MEDRCDESADAGAEEHVPELRHRRIGEHLFDVVLGQPDGRREHRRDAADHRGDEDQAGYQGAGEKIANRDNIW